MTETKAMEVNIPTATERWPGSIGCDCCRKLHSQTGSDDNNSSLNQEVNVSFAGCGFLGIYHLGVLRCFLTHGKHILHRVQRWGGASAGALAAASIICIPNKLDVSAAPYFYFINVTMWHDQGKWVRCRRYCFWDIGKERVPILLFYIVLRVDKFLCNQIFNSNGVFIKM